MVGKTKHDHSAVGPALGYYYQAYYALITLFNSKDDDAFVSIESWDDVYFEEEDKKWVYPGFPIVSSKIKVS
ncbi:MAG: hypothetical protein OEM02_14515 [Desulfobulbaceae bacterium]|nr:hypothetical protein [Desulfobulbaceae bacterium]